VLTSLLVTHYSAIIHGAATEAGAVGLATAQIPGDRFVLGAIQIDMIIQLGQEYGKRIDRAAALGILESQLATLVGVECFNQLVKYIPGIGNVANMSVASSITEALGWAAVKIFER